MAVAFYMDHHVPRAITIALRLRGVDVLTTHEDGTTELDDERLLNRATELNRVLFTQDDDFLHLASLRQRHGIPFSGIKYAHQLRVSIGVCVRDLELIAKICEPDDLRNAVEFLPL